MLIIVEGTDRVGKTTLCETLQDQYGGEIIHFGIPHKSALEEYLEPLLTYTPGAGENVYADRHFLGEAVWPWFFCRAPWMSIIERECIERFLEHRGALCVIATRANDELEEACVDEPTVGRAVESQDMFIREVGNGTIPWYHYQHGDSVSRLVGHAQSLEYSAACQPLYIQRRAIAASGT